MRNFYLSISIATLLAVTGCSKAPYELTDREKKVYAALLESEISTSLSQGDVFDPGLQKRLLGDVVTASTSELQTAYEKNEVAADLSYKDKSIFAKGIVKSIDRGIGESYYLSMSGGSNPFMAPKASMADGYVQYLASLSKGKEVSLACKGGGMLMGSAILKNCEPLDAYLQNKIQSFVAQIRIKEGLTDAEKQMALISITTATLLPETSVCWAGDKPLAMCTSEVHSLLVGGKNSEVANKAFTKAMNDAKVKTGLQVVTKD